MSFFALPDGTQVNITDVLAGRPVFIIGTDKRSHLQLNDAAVAPSHASLSLRDGALVIKPVTPNQLVLVNGKRLTAPTPLQSGDVVQIGDTMLTFDQGEDVVTLAPVQAQVTTTQPYPVSHAAGLSSAQSIPQSTNIYLPASARPAAASTGAGILPAIIGVVAVVGILTFFGLNLALGSGGFSAVSAAAGVEQQFAYKDGNVTLVMFEADWCTYCKQQKPIVTDLSDEYRGDVYISYVDIDAPGSQGLANRYEASSIPLIVIFNDEGKVVTTFRGVTSAQTLRLGIERALLTSTGSPVVES